MCEGCKRLQFVAPAQDPLFWGSVGVKRGILLPVQANHNGIPAPQVSRQSALSNAAWSRGAEGFEMQSSGDFSPAPGSSRISKPGT